MSIYFASMSVTGLYLQNDLDRANNYSDLIDLVHKWFSISEITSNEVKKKWYSTAAKGLYSFLTGNTYESKLNIKI